MGETNTKPTLLAKWGMKASAVATILGMVAAVWMFDDRYAKENDLVERLDTMQVQIISEMRNEVAKNRGAMIANMQRDADDLEFNIRELERTGQTPPRFMIEKHKQILRDIEELKANEE